MELLQQVKIGQQVATNSEVNGNANSAGTSLPTPIIISKNAKSQFWIIDSRASEHMTFDPSILRHNKVLPILVNVNLPNSQRVKVTHAGQVTVHPKLTLNTVLLVPYF